MLPAVHRDMDELEKASASLNMPIDQLKNAFFWFVNATSMDGIALGHLQSGDTDKAIDIFGKKETFSSLLNLAVIASIQGDKKRYVTNLIKIIHDETYRTGLICAVCGDTFHIDEDELIHLFIDELAKVANASELPSLFENPHSTSEDKNYVAKLSIGEPISAINNAIATAKDANNDAESQFNARLLLMTSTKKHLDVVKSTLGTDDLQYQMLADKLAQTILQCGINYYNKTDEDDYISIDKAYKLQHYAETVAVGSMLKSRCKENVDILNKKKKDLPPKEVASEVKYITNELVKFCKLPDKICHAKDLLNNTKPHLQSMKAKLGTYNDYYLKISTGVVGNALHNIIEEVNAVQSDPSVQLSLRLGAVSTIKGVFKSAWDATLLMDGFDMESDFKVNRYNGNRITLRKMCNDLGILTDTSYTTRPTNSAQKISPSPSYYPPQSSQSSNSDENWGCWVVAAIVFIIICISQCH